MMLPTNSAESSTELAAGSTIAETLQGLISPGSTVYASCTAVASTMSTVESEEMSDSSQSLQMTVSATSLSIPPPVAILAPVDNRPASQQGAVGEGTLLQGETGSVVASTGTAAVTSQQPQAVCQFVQPSPQGLVTGQDTASLQGVITPTGAQIISTETAAMQSQVISSASFVLYDSKYLICFFSRFPEKSVPLVVCFYVYFMLFLFARMYIL